MTTRFYLLNGFSDHVPHRLGVSDAGLTNPAWALIEFMVNGERVQVQKIVYTRQGTAHRRKSPRRDTGYKVHCRSAAT